MQSDPNILWRHVLALRHLLVREMQAGMSATAALDLTVPQSIALFQIAEAGPLSLSALQARLARSQSATSHLVTQLERRGLVERAVDPADRRRAMISLSPGGQALLSEVQRLRRAAFDSVVARLPPDVLAQLGAAFSATIEALSGEGEGEETE